MSTRTDYSPFGNNDSALRCRLGAPAPGCVGSVRRVCSRTAAAGKTVNEDGVSDPMDSGSREEPERAELVQVSEHVRAPVRDAHGRERCVAGRSVSSGTE